MLRVGLTGGLASGKSFVGRTLATLGCHVLKADEIGHEVLLPDGEAYEAVVREFGPGILGQDGRIERGRLGELVFNQPERLERLNRLVHPAVAQRQRNIIDAIAAQDAKAIVVVEAAILIETGSYTKFDKLIVVWCSREAQIERAMARDGLTLEQVVARLDRQLPTEEKLKFADFAIETSGAKEETARRTREVFQALRSIQT